MSKFPILLSSENMRKKAADWLSRAPLGWIVEFREQTRSNAQNDLMWALLAEVASQKEHAGMKLSTETWKALFMHELGIECKFIPDLQGKSVLPLGYRSSKLNKSQMTALIETIIKWGIEKGVKFGDQKLTEATKVAA